MLVENLVAKIVVPTYNAGNIFNSFIDAVKNQDGVTTKDVFIVDSSSSDSTVKLAKNAGFQIKIIKHSDFSHGKTRAEMIENVNADIIIFLTQDAILVDQHAIYKLVKVFSDENIAAVYGRQLPFNTTSIFGSFARLFNYGDKSFVNTLDDRKQKGIKTAFFSDSFSAYRRTSLLSIGNFDKNLQYGEDTIAAAKLLLAGYKTAYCSEACVYHAHSYSITEEFNRYRETGALHKKQRWLLQKFGKAEGEGLKFVRAEIKYLISQGKPYLIPLAFARNIAKYFGYWLGIHIG